MNAIEIIRQVASEHGVSSSTLRSRRFPRELFQARSAVYKRLRVERNLSLIQIGFIMGGRHNTTIMHGISDTRRARDMAKVRRYKLTKGASVDA